MKKSHFINLTIIVLSFVISWRFYSRMPSQVASHWNYKGQVDGYLPKFWGLFLMPAISSVLFAFYLLIPKIDPLKANIEKFKNYFENFIILIFLFLFYLHLLTIIWNLGWRFDLIRLLMLALSVLFYYDGVLLEHSKRNYFIGIKTPWSLNSDLVWDKTNKLGGALSKLLSMITLLGLIFPNIALFLIIAVIILTTIYLIFYSYLEYNKSVSSSK